MYASISSSELDRDDALEVYTLDRWGGSGRLVVGLFEHPPTTGDSYTVEDEYTGPADEPAEFASVLAFHGPISPAQQAAARYAGEQRIAPMMAGAPGLSRVLVLWDDDRRRRLVLTLWTSLEQLGAGGQRIASMTLLPEEDTALLPGPDTVEIYQVQSRSLPIDTDLDTRAGAR